MIEAFFKSSQEINLGFSVNRCNSSSTVKTVKSAKIKKYRMKVKDLCSFTTNFWFGYNVYSSSKESYFSASLECTLL